MNGFDGFERNENLSEANCCEEGSLLETGDMTCRVIRCVTWNITSISGLTPCLAQECLITVMIGIKGKEGLFLARTRIKLCHLQYWLIALVRHALSYPPKFQLGTSRVATSHNPAICGSTV
jgi:hypothetical protein